MYHNGNRTLLPWNPHGQHAESLFMNPFEPTTDWHELVVDDHSSSKGVISQISELKPHKNETTTIPPDILIKDLTTSTVHYLQKNGTSNWINPETWKLFFPTLKHNLRIETNTETNSTFQKETLDFLKY